MVDRQPRWDSGRVPAPPPGQVDLFCANAGVAVDGSEQADDDASALSLDVNLHAHARAARRLVPEWLERGEGSAAAATVKAAGDVLTPEAVADVVVAGIREERFLLLPHPEVQDFARRKIDDHDRWIAGMQRLRVG